MSTLRSRRSRRRDSDPFSVPNQKASGPPSKSRRAAASSTAGSNAASSSMTHAADAAAPALPISNFHRGICRALDPLRRRRAELPQPFAAGVERRRRPPRRHEQQLRTPCRRTRAMLAAFAGSVQSSSTTSRSPRRLATRPSTLERKRASVARLLALRLLNSKCS